MRTTNNSDNKLPLEYPFKQMLIIYSKRILLFFLTTFLSFILFLPIILSNNKFFWFIPTCFFILSLFIYKKFLIRNYPINIFTRSQTISSARFESTSSAGFESTSSAGFESTSSMYNLTSRKAYLLHRKRDETIIMIVMKVSTPKIVEEEHSNQHLYSVISKTHYSNAVLSTVENTSLPRKQTHVNT